jgi:hypothetical protein
MPLKVKLALYLLSHHQSRSAALDEKRKGRFDQGRKRRPLDVPGGLWPIRRGRRRGQHQGRRHLEEDLAAVSSDGPDVLVRLGQLCDSE